jgi:hypothetical protein
MSALRWTALAFGLVSAAAGSREPVAAPATPAMALLKQEIDRCNASKSEGCFELVRLNLNDPALLIALGDAEMRVSRPADALRAYRRADVLAPKTSGLSWKIRVAIAKLAPPRPAAPPPAREADLRVPKNFSNAAPETNSH